MWVVKANYTTSNSYLFWAKKYFFRIGPIIQLLSCYFSNNAKVMLYTTVVVPYGKYMSNISRYYRVTDKGCNFNDDLKLFKYSNITPWRLNIGYTAMNTVFYRHNKWFGNKVTNVQPRTEEKIRTKWSLLLCW